jgi:hypothetical protein
MIKYLISFWKDEYGGGGGEGRGKDLMNRARGGLTDKLTGGTNGASMPTGPISSSFGMAQPAVSPEPITQDVPQELPQGVGFADMQPHAVAGAGIENPASMGSVGINPQDEMTPQNGFSGWNMSRSKSGGK